jgi:hypothetical protein
LVDVGLQAEAEEDSAGGGHDAVAPSGLRCHAPTSGGNEAVMGAMSMRSF